MNITEVNNPTSKPTIFIEDLAPGTVFKIGSMLGLKLRDTNMKLSVYGNDNKIHRNRTFLDLNENTVSFYLRNVEVDKVFNHQLNIWEGNQ